MSLSTDVARFVSVVAPSLILGVIFLFCFCLFRTKFPAIFTPRLLWLNIEKREINKLPSGWLNWLPALWRISDSSILHDVGMDALVYLKFLKLGFQLFALLSILGLFILVPINSVGKNGADGFDSISLSNIRDKSPRLWAPTILCYVFSFIVYYLLHKTYMELLIFLGADRSRVAAHHYTVMVNAIPSHHRHQNGLVAYFKSLYKDAFYSSEMTRDCAELDKLMEQFKENATKLDHAKAVFEKSGERPEHKKHILCGEKFDSIDFYSKETERLRWKIEEMRKIDYVCAQTGFVTFNSVAVAAQAAQVRHSPSALEFHIGMAPEARDVYWPNVGLDLKTKTWRSNVVFLITVWLCIFWVVPVTFVSSLANLELLAKRLPFLEPILDANAAVKGFLQGLLPTVAIILLMSLLPPFLRFLQKFGGAESWSRIERGVASVYFFFQVFNVFLVVTLSGTIFASVNEIIQNPASAANLLGSALPQSSTFFINLVILSALGSFPMELSRLVPLIVAKITEKYLAKNEREVRLAYEPGAPAYDLMYPSHLLFFVIILSYSCIAPLILPFGVVFFALAYLVWKNQFIYVYLPKYETGGKMWPMVFRYLLIGVLIAQLSTLGVVSLKYGIIQGPILIPLPFITFIFYGYYNSRYAFLFEGGTIPLETAVQIDQDTSQQHVINTLSNPDTKYVSPSLSLHLDHVLDLPHGNSMNYNNNDGDEAVVPAANVVLPVNAGPTSSSSTANMNINSGNNNNNNDANKQGDVDDEKQAMNTNQLPRSSISVA